MARLAVAAFVCSVYVGMESSSHLLIISVSNTYPSISLPDFEGPQLYVYDNSRKQMQFAEFTMAPRRGTWTHFCHMFSKAEFQVWKGTNHMYVVVWRLQILTILNLLGIAFRLLNIWYLMSLIKLTQTAVIFFKSLSLSTHLSIYINLASKEQIRIYHNKLLRDYLY